MLEQNTGGGEVFPPVQPAQTRVRMGRSCPLDPLSCFTVPSPPPPDAGQDQRGRLGRSRPMGSAVPRPARGFLLPPTHDRAWGQHWEWLSTNKSSLAATVCLPHPEICSLQAVGKLFGGCLESWVNSRAARRFLGKGSSSWFSPVLLGMDNYRSCK